MVGGGFQYIEFLVGTLFSLSGYHSGLSRVFTGSGYFNTRLRHSFVISYDLSCALEMINFGEDDVKEGVLALQQRRPAKFPSAKL